MNAISVNNEDNYCDNYVRSIQNATSAPASNANLEKGVPDFMDPFGDDSVLFMRDYSQISSKASEEKLTKLRQDVDDALIAVQADRMVVGHTIQEDGIAENFNGRVWCIDVGDGIPSRWRFASCVEDPEAYLYEALEITRRRNKTEKLQSNDNGVVDGDNGQNGVGNAGREEIAVLRRVRTGWEKNDWKNKRTVFRPTEED